MIRASKFIIPALFILLSLLNSANASDIHLLNLNVYAWNVFQYQNDTTNAKKITTNINENNYDFITTQEDDTAWGYLTNPIYQLNPKYLLAANARGDAMIYFDNIKWRLDGFNKIPMTPDSGGSRIAVFANFTNRQTYKSVVIATTHLCIHWTKTPDEQDLTCGNRVQIAAHLKDASDLKSYIQSNFSGTPVILTGDFNSVVGGLSQGMQIKDKLAPYLMPVTDDVTKGLLGPTFNSFAGFPTSSNPTETIDFIYHNSMLKQVSAKLYTKSVNGNPQDPKSNPSDHEGQIVDMDFGDTPPSVPCDVAPTAAYNYHSATNTVTIDVDSNNASNLASIELWPWNQTQGTRTASTSDKHLTYNSPALGNPGPDNSYEFWARNTCVGSSDPSPWTQIKFYKK